MIKILLMILPVLVLADYNATQTADNLNLTYENYNFLMALSGLLVGFILLFFSLLLVSK